MSSLRHELASNSAIALVVASIVGWSAHAPAQTAQAAAKPFVNNGIEQVVVTARRRAERLQKVPVAVTALSSAQIAQNKVVAVNDLQSVTPSLTFQQSSYGTFGSLVGIRGQRTEDTVLSQSPSIGIYVDDVYAPSTFATGLGNLFDTSQIEVLKGPQGTLYGRNTVGGALKVTSNPPDYTGLYGTVKVGFGNYGSLEDAAMLNVPIIPDKAVLRVDYEHVSHDGYGYDHTNDRDVDDADSENFRAALKLDPTEDLDVVVRANLSNGFSGGVLANLEAVAPVFGKGGVPTFSPALLNVGLETGSLTFAELLPFLAPQYYGPPSLADYEAVLAGQEAAYKTLTKYLKQGYNVNYSQPEDDVVKDKGVSINAVYHINDDLAIRSITSYQYAYQGADSDVDGSPLKVLEGPGDVSSLDQFTDELQVVGNGLDNKLTYTAGFYYYYLTGIDDSPGEQELPYLNVTGSPVHTNDKLTDESYAFFAQGTYAFTPRVHVTGGVRFTNESTSLIASSTDGPANSCNVPPPGGVNGAACSDTFTQAFHAFNYLASIDWAATDNILLYAKVSDGFRAGGQNQRGSVIGGFASFAPEKVTSYEIGEKSDFLDHRVRINAAAYHSVYTNIQRSVLTVTASQQTITEIVNAAAATIDGVEAELTARPIPPLVLNANMAYTHPKYTSYFADGVNLTNNLFQDQPLWQLNIGGTYTYDFAIANTPAALSTTVNLAYQSKVNLGPDDQSIYDNGYLNQGGYGVLNARIALDIPRYAVTIEGWGKNLTDRKYLTGATDVVGALGTGVAYLSDPRTFGFSVTKKF
jgi:iron complex outermembrane receptor protein